jgi:hypothetical protein
VDYFDTFGYYTIDGIKTYSKYELMEIYNKRPQAFSWHFNDEIYRSYDWTVEPSATLDDLYKARAEELRDKYDYIVLMYSGGHDSANILWSFLDNNIHVDELCTFYSKEDKVSLQYQEVENYTFDKLNLIQEAHPEIKIRRLDLSDQYFEWHKIAKDADVDYEYFHGNTCNANLLIRNTLPDIVKDYRDLIDSGKKVAFVWGVDKPIVKFTEQGRWVVVFTDAIIHGNVGPYISMTKNNKGTHELFYWSATSPVIVIKQAHLIKQKFLDNEKLKNLPCKIDWGQQPKGVDITDVIYPRNFKFSEEFYLVKPTFHYLGSRDWWWFNSNCDAAKQWQKMMQSIKNSASSFWLNDGVNMSSSFKSCVSQEYVLSK